MDNLAILRIFYVHGTYIFKKVCIYLVLLFFFFLGTLSNVIIHSFILLGRDSNTVLRIRTKMFYLKCSGRNSLSVCCMHNIRSYSGSLELKRHTE